MSGLSTLSYRNVLGLNKLAHPNVLFVSEESIVFAAGNSIVMHNINSRQQRIFSPPDTLKSGVSALAYSEAKPKVAFADNSIEPTVCLFDIPTHQPLYFFHLGAEFESTGLVSLSFSSDGKYLVGMGSKPGWNIAVWQIETSQRILVMKVSEDETPVTQVSFSPGKTNYIAVTGNNILKVYQLENNRLKDIIFADPKIGNIMCHLWLNENTLLCANSSGDIISVLTDNPSSIIGRYDHRDSPFLSLARTKSGFVGVSEGGYLTVFEAPTYQQELQVKLFGDELPLAAHSVSVDPQQETAVVTLANNRIISVSLKDGDILLNSEEKPLVMPMHDGPILSISTCHRKPLVATCGSDKTVRVFNYLENTMEIVKEFTENVYSVSLSPDGLSILIGFGDKLRLCGVFYDDIRPFREFPIRGCRCAKFSSGGSMFAAVNGSKIQIYSALTFQLTSTLHRHSAGVHALVWGESDTVVASAGADGALYVHRPESAAREDSLATPQVQHVSLCASSDFSSLFVSGTDGRVREVQSGQVVREVQLGQSGQLALPTGGHSLFVGTRDGGVLSLALPLGGDRAALQAHTSPVSAIALSHDDSLLFTGGEDGVLCVFAVRDRDSRLHAPERASFSEEVLTTRGEVEEKQNQLRTLRAERDDLEVTYKTKRDMVESTHRNREDRRREKAKKEKEKWRIKIENLKKEKDEAEMLSKAAEIQETRKWEDNLAAEEERFGNEIFAAHKECEMLATERTRLDSEWEGRLSAESSRHKQVVEELKQGHRRALESVEEELRAAIESRKETSEHCGAMKTMITQEKQRAVEATRQKLRTIEDGDEELRGALQDELGNKNKEKLALAKQYEAQQSERLRLSEAHDKLQAQLGELEREIAGLREQAAQKDSAIRDREVRIGGVKKENQELEKYHSVLSHQEAMLRKQTGPLESEIDTIEGSISEMDGNLESAHKSTAEQNETISDMQARLQSVIEKERAQARRLMSAKGYFEQAKHDLHNVVQNFHSKERLRDTFLEFYQRYVKSEKIEDIQLDEAVEEEHRRQRATLARQLRELRGQHSRDDALQAKEQAKLLMQNSTLIEELQRLRTQNRALNSSAALAKKASGEREMMPASEAQRVIEENKKKIARLEEQLSSYHEGSRPGT